MLGLFSGITVLEIADFIAGPYCARLLADLGARVIKVEPPHGGDSARNYGPFPDDVPNRERSGLYLLHNTNKESITLDPSSPRGRELLARLAASADLLVEDTPPGTMRELGLDFSSLHATNPSLVYVSITPYGQDGPKAPWAARHINTFHASGEGYTLPGGIGYATFPQRGPVTAGGHLGEYDAGLQAAIAAVAALYAREVWGVGQHVDISKQESGLALNRLLLAQFLGQDRRVDRSRTYEYGGIYSCRDGYVILYPREDQHWQALAAIMEQPELGQDDRFRTRASRIQNGAKVNGILAAWAATLGKEDIYYRVAPSGCPSAYFATAAEVMASPQLAERGFFQEIEHPRAGRLPHPSLPFLLSSSPDLPQRPAPMLGQHNEQVLGQELGVTPQELADLRRSGVV